MPTSAKTSVSTRDAPAAIGPYSQAILAGGLLFTSGQIALDPETGGMVEGGVAGQTERVLANLRAVLDAAGLTPAHVVKTTIFLANMSDFQTVNEIYGRFFGCGDGAVPPARSTVAVAELPRRALVEIEAIAAAGPEA